MLLEEKNLPNSRSVSEPEHEKSVLDEQKREKKHNVQLVYRDQRVYSSAATQGYCLVYCISYDLTVSLFTEEGAFPYTGVNVPLLFVEYQMMCLSLCLP